MKEIYSKACDLEFLAYELTKILGDKISINYFVLGQEVLTGKISVKKNQSAKLEGIDFNIKFDKDNFLRINTGEIQLTRSYIDKFNALLDLKEAISKIEINEGLKVGLPHAFYYIISNNYLIPYFDWAFKNKEEYLSELKNNTMFKDAKIEYLNILEFNNINYTKKLRK